MPVLVAWSLVLEKNCEQVWGLKKSPKPHINRLSLSRLVPRVCCARGDTLSWSWGSREVLSALFPTLSDQDGRAPWKEQLLSPGSPGLRRTPDWASLLLTFSTLVLLPWSRKLNCPSWAKSLCSSPPMPGFAGGSFHWLHYSLISGQK